MQHRLRSNEKVPVSASCRKLSRREFFLKTSLATAGLFLGWHIMPVKAGAVTNQSFQPNTLLNIDRQGKVTLWYKKTEMGQGVSTLAAMVAAEELDVPLEDVRVITPSPGKDYPSMITGGSSSASVTYTLYRQQVAVARTLLLQAGAQNLRVVVERCYTKDGHVVDRQSGQRVAYGDLVDVAAQLPIPTEVEMKAPAEFKILGNNHAIVNSFDMITGRTRFGMDYKIPGMVHACIVRSPVVGGQLISYDDTALQSLKGYLTCVRVEGNAVTSYPEHLREGVAVVTTHTWAAIKGASLLKTTWDEGKNKNAHTGTYMQQLRNMAAEGGTVFREEGNIEAAFAAADHVLEATYEGPFLSHAPLEPMNATASVTDQRCEVWVPTHDQSRLVDGIRQITGLTDEQITIHTTAIGGSFGRRLQVDYALEAVLISAKVAKPVQLLWTREDDTRFGVYRTPYVQKMKGAVKNGKVTAFSQQIACSSVWRLREPGMLTGPLDYTVLMPAKILPYAIPGIRMSQHITALEVPIGWYRASYPMIHHTVQECWIDELAVAAQRDPLALRLELLDDDSQPLHFAWQEGWGEDVVDRKRLKRVLQLAAEKANWKQKRKKGHGMGIACHFYGGTYVAQVVKVAVAGKRLQVLEAICAVDCGRALNPSHIQTQIEGGMVFGLTAALYGEITFENGRVEQSNFHNYRMLAMKDAPAMEVVIVPSEEAVSGVGEPGSHPILAATCNAVFDACGQRIRQLPILKYLGDS